MSSPPLEDDLTPGHERRSIKRGDTCALLRLNILSSLGTVALLTSVPGAFLCPRSFLQLIPIALAIVMGRIPMLRDRTEPANKRGFSRGLFG